MTGKINKKNGSQTAGNRPKRPKKGSLAREWKGADEVVAVNVGPGLRGGWRPGKGVTQGVAEMAAAGYGSWPIAWHVEPGDRVVFVMAPETRQAMGVLNAQVIGNPEGVAERAGGEGMDDAEAAAAIAHGAFVAKEKAGMVFASATVDHVIRRVTLSGGTEVSVAALADVKPVACEFPLAGEGYRYETMAARTVDAERLFAAEDKAMEEGGPGDGGTCFPLVEETRDGLKA